MNSKKGSVLILTLWTLSFLTVFSIGLANNISAQLRVASHLQDRLKMYYLAAAGIERGIVEITGNDETPSYDTLNETWSNNEESFNELPLGDGYITLSYQLNKEMPESQSVQESGEITLYGLMDESSKININEVPAGVLKTLLGNIGEVEKEEASDIANSIIDWRDLDVVVSSGGAEDFYYQSLESPYPCKNGKFQVLEELLLVKGMTPELFLKIKDVITIYGDSRVNINTADRLTLRALGLSSELAKRIVEFRQGSGGEGEAEEDKNFFKTVAELNNIGALFTEESQELSRVISLNILTVKSDTFRINSHGILKKEKGSLQRCIGCVVRRYKNKGPKILYWHEE